VFGFDDSIGRMRIVEDELRTSNDEPELGTGTVELLNS
jgi:hypothetical protein